ncbi:hypothetical protein FOA52_011825 [Chlamydomonas sp. UWO 241]|nr:hypothetical protein FOA52_011825 [Chlamydomonas sp. UWO 241]
MYASLLVKADNPPISGAGSIRPPGGGALVASAVTPASAASRAASTTRLGTRASEYRAAAVRDDSLRQLATQQIAIGVELERRARRCAPLARPCGSPPESSG